MVFQYLTGRRRAILEVAADRSALAVGCLLVLSAGLARNYDQASLLHEPWRLLGPFVASLAISGTLFLTIYMIARWKGIQGPGIGRAYLTFLALYWMTAPLAWLYAIPYEHFLPSLEAVRANLWTLALVSAWRVVLMIRAVSVVFGLRVRAALPFVMLVADAAALGALELLPMPVVALMGGISPENAMVANTAMLVRVLGWLTLPVWIIWSIWVLLSSRTVAEWRVPSLHEPSTAGRGALVFAALALAAWGALLPFTQPKQFLAYRVDRAYRDFGPHGALEIMSAHERSEFPAAWRPPPPGYPLDPTAEEFLATLEALAARRQADWVRAAYKDLFLDRLTWFEVGPSYWSQELLTSHPVRLAGILTRLPEGPAMARGLLRDHDYMIKSLLAPGSNLTEDQRAAIESLIRLAGDRPESSEARKS